MSKEKERHVSRRDRTGEVRMITRWVHLFGVIFTASVLTGEAASKPPSRSTVPDGGFTFAHRTEGFHDNFVLSQFSCAGGECVLASAILTSCEKVGGTTRRMLAVDAATTRQGRLKVASQRRGDVAIIEVEEAIPLATERYSFTVSLESDGRTIKALVAFKGISLEKTPRELRRLSSAEKKLTPCGLKLLENALEFASE